MTKFKEYLVLVCFGVSRFVISKYEKNENMKVS